MCATLLELSTRNALRADARTRAMLKCAGCSWGSLPTLFGRGISRNSLLVQRQTRGASNGGARMRAEDIQFVG
eukprot:2273202-Pleurochrysis_carterae.AAC.5